MVTVPFVRTNDKVTLNDLTLKSLRKMVTLTWNGSFAILARLKCQQIRGTALMRCKRYMIYSYASCDAVYTRSLRDITDYSRDAARKGS